MCRRIQFINGRRKTARRYICSPVDIQTLNPPLARNREATGWYSFRTAGGGFVNMATGRSPEWTLRWTNLRPDTHRWPNIMRANVSTVQTTRYTIKLAIFFLQIPPTDCPCKTTTTLPRRSLLTAYIKYLPGARSVC